MFFHSPIEALSLLGLDVSATREDIKSAYHRMAAYYHPDAGMLEEEQATDAFLRVREAYDYLMEAYDQAYAAFLAGQRAPKIIGGDRSQGRQSSRETAIERQRQERRAKKRQEEKIRKQKEELRAAKEEHAYEEAMMRIYALRAAEIVAKMMK